MENLNPSEEQSSAEMITEYAGLLWRWAWLLILLAALAGGTAYYLSSRQTPVYEASTTISIDVAPTSQTVTATMLTTSEQLAESYAQEMVMQPVLDDVSRRLGLAAFPLTATVQVQPITNTQLIKVVVQDTDPKRAALLANTLVQVFSDKVQADQASRYADTKKSIQAQMAALDQNNQTATSAVTAMKQQIQETTNALTAVNDKIQLDTTKLPLAAPETIDADKNTRDQLQITLVQYQSQLAQLQTTQSQYQQSYNSLFQSYQSILLAEAQSSSGVIQQNPAIPPVSPVKPQPVRNALLAAVVGLMLAAGIVFLIEFLDDSLRDPEEITRKWGIPMLGMIVNFDSDNGSELITEIEPRSPVSEAFRSIRTNLQFASVTSPLHTLLVTSPSPEDGKTTVVANLACVFAQVGRKVVVVDSDLRRPSLHKLFELPNRFGLTDQFIRPQEYLNGAVQPTEVKNLYLLSSGSLPPNPSELISSQRMVEIIQTLEAQYEVVFLDAPPSLVVTDANVLANHADGVILVIRPSTTKRAAIKHTIEQMAQVKANIIGVVLNGVNVKKSRYSYYRGYYNKYGRGYAYYSDGSSSDKRKRKSRKGSARESSHGSHKVETKDTVLNSATPDITDPFRNVQGKPAQFVAPSPQGAPSLQAKSESEDSLTTIVRTPRKNTLSGWIGNLRSHKTNDPDNPLEPGSESLPDKPGNKP
jgi:non-specific protein-tyrosine kinase